jgi:Putative zinc-finger
MERASLRPVPRRPSGAVEPAEALAHVRSALPDLDEAAAQVLALVELAGRTRPQTSAESGIAPAEVAEALARARKALRRATFPLPGSGWCERAERLLSDELDGALEEPGPRRLAAHLANCDRCVEHERRLWQVRDRLVVSFDEARAPVPLPEPLADEPDPEPVELPDPQPQDPPQPEPTVPAQPVAAPAPELRLVNPAAEVPAPTIPEPADPLPADPVPSDPEPASPEPADPPPAATEAVAAALPDTRFSLTGLAWTAGMALAVLLTLVSLALTIYAIVGGSF